jgi:hypothetical protein
MKFLTRFCGKIVHNGKRLCEGGAFTPKISIKTAPSKNHFRFCKITKNLKTKWFFATNND